MRRSNALRHQYVQRSADHFVRVVAEQPLRFAIEAEDSLLCVDRDDRLSDRRDKLCQPVSIGDCLGGCRLDAQEAVELWRQRLDQADDTLGAPGKEIDVEDGDREDVTAYGERNSHDRPESGL